MRKRTLWLLRATPMRVAIGIMVATSLIVVETFLGYPLKRLATTEPLGMLYLLGVVIVSTIWGFWLGAGTAFFSAVALDYFHIPPLGTLFIYDTTEQMMIVVVFLAVALLVGCIAKLAQSRAVEAEDRRLEADLAAELARLLLRAHDLCSALPVASQRLAQRLGLPFAAIELTVARGDERQAAFPLRDEAKSLGTLLVPNTLPEPAMRRLRDRVVPSLEELLHAAREREVIADALQASRDELAASRARVVVAADESRRRLERDLHDGVQQRLVSLGLELRAAEAMVPAEQMMVSARLSRMARDLAQILEDLQELSRGLHPPILSKSGLGPALKALARRSPVRVELNVHVDQRLAERVEVAVYYVVSEALTNTAKHARASVVYVDLQSEMCVDSEKEEAIVRLCVRDDGAGGADPDEGTGLIGLTDRVAVLGGTLEITSPLGGGTALLVQIPIEDG
jgi:signal transduction histidine kinase